MTCAPPHVDTLQGTRNRVIDCIEGRCSMRRFHSALGCRSLEEFEEECFGYYENAA